MSRRKCGHKNTNKQSWIIINQHHRLVVPRGSAYIHQPFLLILAALLKDMVNHTVHKPCSLVTMGQILESKSDSFWWVFTYDVLHSSRATLSLTKWCAIECDLFFNSDSGTSTGVCFFENQYSNALSKYTTNCFLICKWHYQWHCPHQPSHWWQIQSHVLSTNSQVIACPSQHFQTHLLTNPLLQRLFCQRLGMSGQIQFQYCGDSSHGKILKTCSK